MADIKGLLADPRFNSLDIASQKQALGRVDSRFADLSDADFSSFKSRMQSSGKSDLDYGKETTASPSSLIHAPRTPTEERAFREMTHPLDVSSGTAVMASPLMPSEQFIPAAVGYGVEKLGESEHTPWWVTVPASLLAGALAAGGGSVYQRLRQIPKEQRQQAFQKAAEKLPWGAGKLYQAYKELFGETPPEPFRPNPQTAEKMRYGGPTKEEYHLGRRTKPPSVRPSERGTRNVTLQHRRDPASIFKEQTDTLSRAMRKSGMTLRNSEDSAVHLMAEKLGITDPEVISSARRQLPLR